MQRGVTSQLIWLIWGDAPVRQHLAVLTVRRGVYTLMLTLQQQTRGCRQGYREDDGLWLESDTDEQLLLHIQFNQGVTAARARHALTACACSAGP